MVLDQRYISPEEELTTDVLAILTVSGTRVSGLRCYTGKPKKIWLYPVSCQWVELRRWFAAPDPNN